MEYFASAVHLCGYAFYTGHNKPTHTYLLICQVQ